MLKKIFITVLSFLVISVQASLELVKDSKSAYNIFVDANALPITKRAAKDLQLYIKKATGAELPIVKTVSADKPCIFVGDSEFSRKAGINISDIKPEGYVIKTVGKNLYIVGKDTEGPAETDHWRSAPQAGTWNGVSSFLEKYLDIRWFFPGEYGEYVPVKKDFTIDDINISDYPKMEYRRISYLYWKDLNKERVRDVIDWERRNKNGWSVIWSGSHTWVENFKQDDYFKAHPEWFGLVNGRRLEVAQYFQMCTTNKEALDKFAEIAIKISGERNYKKDNTMFSLSPNDGGNHCECPKCQALDNGVRPDGTQIMTDRYVTYCNEMAKRVNKVLPWQTFGFYAYSFYVEPPLKTTLDPHAKVMYVLNDNQTLYYSEAVRKKFNEDISGWKKAVGSLYYYTHPEGMGNMALPAMHPTGIKKIFGDLGKAGITGISMNNGEPFDSTALDNYLYEKMAWDPMDDMDKIYDDAIKKCYGENAAPYVRKYFDTVENAVMKFSEKITVDSAMGSARRFPGLLLISYPELYDEGMPLLKKAAETEADKNQKYRLQMLIDNLEYCRDTVELYSLFQKINKTHKPDKKDILRALELARKRIAYLKGLEKEGRVNFDSEQFREKDFNMPFSPQIYSTFLKQLEGGSKKVYANEVPSADLTDGKVFAEFWEKIPSIDLNFDKNTGDALSVKASAKIAYDKNNIYINVYCEEPLMDKIKDSCRQPDGAVWNENEIEFFFDIKNSQKDFKQICVNTLGTVADYESINDKSDAKWNSEVKTSVLKSDKFWNLEISVPFKSLSGNTPKPGEIWGLNICRARRTLQPDEYGCWSPTFGGFLKPERFGKLIFK